MQFYKVIENLLLSNEKYQDQEGKLIKSLVIDSAFKIDSDLIELLITNEQAKAKFFKEIAGHWVFNINDFILFIQDKNFLDDSYTRFKNKIGLNIDDKFLKQRDEVALVWPYKDCVLEGNQDKEDTKRQEIFFNEVLAQDEIDRLLDPKVLVNWTRHTVNGDQKVTDLKRDENGTIKENLLIKGNNLLALHTLKKQFRNKVKLIYIDPPYNTGNDGFKYNDRFNHSTWLTFMKNRLEVAKELLRDDGVIFVQCDDNEQAYLKILMDEVFGRENFVGDLIRKTKSVTNDAKVGLNIQHENTLIFAKLKIRLKLVGTEKNLDNYSNPDNDPNGDWVSSDPSARTGNTKFEIINPFTNKVDLPPNARCWAFSKESLDNYILNGKITFKKEIKNNERGFIYKRYKNELKDGFNLLNSLDGVDNKYMNQVATKEKNILTSQEFQYPKPEEFLKLIIQSSTQHGDIVLDYHLGSGTTCAVAHKMGRQCIGIEQMDYIETIAVERLNKVIDGEQGGISKAVNWQGGGDFIYLELAKYNETFMDSVQSATTTNELLKIWLEMKEKAFLDYRVETANFDSEEFKTLSIEEQKNLLVQVLDKNQLYVNYTEMEDKTYGISQEDKDLTNKFYKK